MCKNPQKKSNERKKNGKENDRKKKEDKPREKAKEQKYMRACRMEDERQAVRGLESSSLSRDRTGREGEGEERHSLREKRGPRGGDSLQEATSADVNASKSHAKEYETENQVPSAVRHCEKNI